MKVNPQLLIIGIVFLLAFAYLVFLSFSGNRRRFAPIATASTLFLGATFAFVTSLYVPTWRLQVLTSMMPELFFNLLIAAICLAQAGRLPNRRSTALAEVAKRPRVQIVLSSAPVVLLISWLMALIFGLVRPVPALEAFASAEPEFLAFRWLLVLPQAFYTGLAAWMFFKASGPDAPTRRLRIKNLSYSVATLAWFIWASNAAVHGLMRVVLPADLRETVVGVQLMLELLLAVTSVLAFAIGLTLRFAPAVNETVVRKVYPSLLRLRERFESVRWHSVKGSKIQGLQKASFYASEAGHILGLSSESLQKTITTVELAALLRSSSKGTEGLTNERAGELFTLQDTFVDEEELVSKISWPATWDAPDGKQERMTSGMFDDALKAAHVLTGAAEVKSAVRNFDESPWYHLAAVATVDAGLIEPEKAEDAVTDAFTYRRTLDAYQTAKSTLHSRIAEGDR